jgi:competence protein ComEC
VVLGAFAAAPAPRAVACIGVVVGFGARRPWLVVASLLLVASSLGAAAHDGLRNVAFGPLSGTATLVADPVEGRFDTSAEVRLGAKRWLVRATGPVAGALAQARMGERVAVQGTSRAPPPEARWMVARHLAGVVSATSAEVADRGAAPYRAANRVRSLIEEGAEVLPESQRPLFAGLVIGEDRGQSPELVDDFRASGLSHVLVVSGQNLAFVLALLQPVTTRVSWGHRWLFTMGAIGAFALVTRLEPSVLRASVMAAIAITGRTLGRPQQTRRVLALAVAGLVLVDPLLVHSVGFQLSVAASAGIALLAEPLANRIPGPPAVVEVIASTVAAQLGVAPVLIPFVGGLPVVALIANPLAVPVAGFITMWGLPAGLLAGLLAALDLRWAAEVVHLPTQVMVAWVAAVARHGARLPMGEAGGAHLVAVVVLGAVAGELVPAVRGRWPRRMAVAGLAVVLATPALSLARQPSERALGEGMGRVIDVAGATIVTVDGRHSEVRLLQSLRRAGVRRVDLLVEGHGRGPRTAALLRHRWPVTSVVERPEVGVVLVELGSKAVTVPAQGRIEVNERSP